MLGLYLDTNVNQLILEGLNDENVLHNDVYRQQQADEKADIRVLARARQLGLALVSYDLDFLEIHELIISTPGLAHAGIILVVSESLQDDPDQLAYHLVRLAYKYEGHSDLLWNQLLPL